MKKLLFLICAYIFLVSFCDKPEIILTSTWGYAGGQYTPGNNITLDAENLNASNYKILINYDADIKNKDGDETIYLTVSVPDIFGIDTTKISKSNFRFISKNINLNYHYFIPYQDDSLNVPTQNSNNQTLYTNFKNSLNTKENIKDLLSFAVFAVKTIIEKTNEINRKANVFDYKFIIDGKNQRKGFVEFTLNIPKDLKYSNMAFNIMATVEYNQENLICPDRTATETITHVIQMPYNNINTTQKE